MYQITIKNDKIYLLNTATGKFLNELNGQPKEYPSIERAELGRDFLNTPVTIIPQKVTGVMDNRHRNWKRRR